MFQVVKSHLPPSREIGEKEETDVRKLIDIDKNIEIYEDFVLKEGGMIWKYVSPHICFDFSTTDTKDKYNYFAVERYEAVTVSLKLMFGYNGRRHPRYRDAFIDQDELCENIRSAFCALFKHLGQQEKNITFEKDDLLCFGVFR